MMSAALNAIRGALATLQTSITSITSTISTTADDGTVVRKKLVVLNVQDGDELQISGLQADGFYELWAFKSTPATTTGGSTHRQKAIYDKTGALAGDLGWQEPASVARADAVTNPLSDRPLLKADNNGRLYVVYSVTPAAPGNDIGETLTFDLVPRRAS